MAGPWMGELVWIRERGQVNLYVDAPAEVRSTVVDTASSGVFVSNLKLPWRVRRSGQKTVYKTPITLHKDGTKIVSGPVFGILAGSGTHSFIGSRLNFRDIMQVGQSQGKFVYVLAPESVNEQKAIWRGYVRLGYQRWLEVPCPRPEAVYNRIPTRLHERQAAALAAKAQLQRAGIPMFNTNYFSKAVIYDIIRRSNMGSHLPETSSQFSRAALNRLLRRNDAVYLKPTGGSIGHGMVLIRQTRLGYAVRILKNNKGSHFSAANFVQVWGIVNRHRVPGQYVMQAAKPLLTWQGRPCDFRVLLQKHRNRWHLIGKGVRVAGPDSITTHVPNGGSIANAKDVLKEAFGDRSSEVNLNLQNMTIQCAQVIDAHYNHALGEMSMDIGIDANGDLWFFEANAKPMKFDEPDIRRKSLLGVIAHLDELRKQRTVG